MYMIAHFPLSHYVIRVLTNAYVISKLDTAVKFSNTICGISNLLISGAENQNAGMYHYEKQVVSFRRKAIHGYRGSALFVHRDVVPLLNKRSEYWFIGTTRDIGGLI